MAPRGVGRRGAWGQRAKALIADLPAGGFVVATDGGSNPEDRSKTGWGVIVVKKTTSGHPVVVAELFGPVTTDPYDDDYYIGSPTKDNDTAEMEASYQGLLWLWNNETHVPAVIISDSERALTAMDGHRAVVGSGAAELYCGPSGGVNVVLANHLHKMFNQEARRRNGGLDVGHVKGHSGDPLNDRADMLAGLGKGGGPYSRQMVLRTFSLDSTAASHRRVCSEGYPHQAVPGDYCCVWATEDQRCDVTLPTLMALPPMKERRNGRRTTPPDYGSGVKLFGSSLTWHGLVGGAGGPPDRRSGVDAASLKSRPRKTKLNLKKLAGTPSAELYNTSLVSAARFDCLTGSVDEQLAAGDLNLVSTLCNQAKISAINAGVFSHWNDLIDRAETLDAPGFTRRIYGAPAPFVRSQPFLRRSARTRAKVAAEAAAQAQDQQVRGSTEPKIINASYHTDISVRDRLFRRREKAELMLNAGFHPEAERLFHGRIVADTLFCGPASIRFSARAHRPPPRSPSHLRRSGRAPQLAGSALRKRFLGVKVHPLTGLRFGVGDGLGGTARGLAGVHIHQIGHAAGYPAARLRRVYGGHTDDRDERGAGSEQEELWSRYFGINVGSLPNVRLGQRTPPNESDWKRYWDAAAAEPVLLADTLATRRKERRRLYKEWQLAINGKAATKKRKARLPDLLKASVLKHQLDEWKDDDDAQEVVPAASIDVDQDDDGASQSPIVDAAEAAVGDEMEAGETSMSVEDADDSPMGQVQPRLRIRTVTTSRRKSSVPMRAHMAPPPEENTSSTWEPLDQADYHEGVNESQSDAESNPSSDGEDNSADESEDSADDSPDGSTAAQSLQNVTGNSVEAGTRQLHGAGRQVDEDLPTNRGAIGGLVASRAQSDAAAVSDGSGGGAQARRSSSSVYAARDEF